MTTFSHRRTGSVASVVDGNALAGPLLSLLGVDATSLSLTCRRCGRAGALAETIVERVGGRLVVRCRGCRHVLLTAVIDPGGDAVEIELDGLGALRRRDPR